jgi:Bacterial transcriptional activator domain
MALPQGVLATRSPGYAIRVAPDEFDLHRFERLVDEGRSLLARGLAADASERLRDALSLWRGPALSDFANGRFAQAAIARLEEIRLAAVELRIDADLVLGRHHKLVGGGGLASHGPMTRRAEQAAAHHTGSVLRSDRRLEVDGFVAGRPSYRSAPDAGRPASGARSLPAGGTGLPGATERLSGHLSAGLAGLIDKAERLTLTSEKCARRSNRRAAIASDRPPVHPRQGRVALGANALLEEDSEVGQATACWAAELRLERDLAFGADPDVGAGVGHAVAVEVEGDQAVEALTGLGIDEALVDPALEPLGDEQDLIVGTEHDLGAGGLVLLTGVGALKSEHRSSDDDGKHERDRAHQN